MSSLQVGLAVVGGLVLAAVVTHTAWSARRSLPKRAAPVTHAGAAGLSAATADTAQAPSAQQQAQQDRQEPRFDTGFEHSFEGAAGDTDLALSALLRAPSKKPGLDALIDSIAPISLESAVSGEAVLAAMPPTRRVGGKAFGVEGLNAASSQWELPLAGQRYSALQCGVQLASRTGVLNQMEYSEFVMKTQALADAVGGEPEFPDMRDEIARARELDQFASSHDAQLSFTLRTANTAWSPGYVQQHAAQLGFIAGAIAGRMVLPARQPGQAPVLGLSFDGQAALADDPEQTALHALTLTLDVPHVQRTEQPFARLCEAALTLAASMDGVLMDDQGQRISPEAMEVIHADLEKLYDTLDGHEFSAGSVLARRLFS